MKTIQSKLFSLGGSDLLKGALVAVFTAILTTLYTSLSQTPPVFPKLSDLQGIGVAGLTAGLSYLLKNFLQNSNGQVLKAEPTTPNNG